MNRTMKMLAAAIMVGAIAVVVIVVANRSSNNPPDTAARFGVATARAAEPIEHIGTGKSALAVEKAANDGKYVYALFYREQNDPTEQARTAIEAARKKISRKSQIVEINASDPAEQDIVNKFRANRTPTPFVLVLAPNGAVMGGFPGAQIIEEQLVEAVGTRASEQTLKALQQRNMVALCLQNRKTAERKAVLRGVEEFIKDPKYAQNTAVVIVDPSDPAEAKFLRQLNIDSEENVATTVLLAPPGAVIGTFKGAVQKDQLITAVQAAAAPKSSGCCPPGSGKSCGPTASAPAPQKTPVTLQAQPPVKQLPTTSAAAPTSTAKAPMKKEQGK